MNFVENALCEGPVLSAAIRVTHFAESQKSNPATSFSHPFYLVIHEYAKKVEKSYHLGVGIHPPWFM